MSERGSILPGIEAFNNILMPDKALHLSFQMAAASRSKVEVPNFAKAFSLTSANGDVVVGLDEEPVFVATAATLIPVSILGPGIIIKSGTGVFPKIFCFDVHGIVPKKLFVLSAGLAVTVTVSFF